MTERKQKMKMYKLAIINKTWIEPSDANISFMGGFMLFGFVMIIPSILFGWLFPMIFLCLGIIFQIVIHSRFPIIRLVEVKSK